MHGRTQFQFTGSSGNSARSHSSGPNPLQVAGVTVAAGEFVVGYAEFSNEAYDHWRATKSLKDGSRPYYKMNVPGNKYTGGKNAALARAATYRLIGRVLLPVGVGINAADALAGNTSPLLAVADSAVAVLGTFGGPAGLVAAGVYFGARYAIQYIAVLATR